MNSLTSWQKHYIKDKNLHTCHQITTRLILVLMLSNVNELLALTLYLIRTDGINHLILLC